MAKKSGKAQAPRIKPRELAPGEMLEDAATPRKASAGTQVNCFDEVYSTGGRWYGPGVVTIEDEEVAETIQNKVNQVEGQKRKDAESMSKGVVPTSSVSAIHHWNRGDGQVAPVIPTRDSVDEDTEEDDDESDIDEDEDDPGYRASGLNRNDDEESNEE